jgi:hypothetical protein
VTSHDYVVHWELAHQTFRRYSPINRHKIISTLRTFRMWIFFGISGATVGNPSHLHDFLSAIRRANPAHLIVHLGGNDWLWKWYPKWAVVTLKMLHLSQVRRINSKWTYSFRSYKWKAFLNHPFLSLKHDTGQLIQTFSKIWRIIIAMK